MNSIWTVPGEPIHCHDENMHEPHFYFSGLSCQTQFLDVSEQGLWTLSPLLTDFLMRKRQSSNEYKRCTLQM
jgi:hypothetical protein